MIVSVTLSGYLKEILSDLFGLVPKTKLEFYLENPLFFKLKNNFFRIKKYFLVKKFVKIKKLKNH